MNLYYKGGPRGGRQEGVPLRVPGQRVVAASERSAVHGVVR